jgi:hypothetical protein
MNTYTWIDFHTWIDISLSLPFWRCSEFKAVGTMNLKYREGNKNTIKKFHFCQHGKMWNRDKCWVVPPYFYKSNVKWAYEKVQRNGLVIESRGDALEY